MGLFDVFTGASAKNAAAKNNALYADYGQKSQGWIDDGGRAADASYGRAADAFVPLADLGAGYNKAGSLAMDALGVNGADGNARATAAFEAGPGYTWERDQAVEAARRAGAATGATDNGNTLAAIVDRAANVARTGYQGWLGNLKGYADTGAQTTGAAASGTAGVYGTQAGAYDNRAQARSNVANNVASGAANSNTAAASAQTQASAQFWNSLIGAAGSIFGGKR